MTTNGLKISEMKYSSLEDAVNDNAQVPVSVDVNGVKENRRVPIQLIKGYQGEAVQGPQGYQGNQGYQGAVGSQGVKGDQGNQGGTIVGGYDVVVTQYGTVSSYSNNTLYFLYA